MDMSHKTDSSCIFEHNFHDITDIAIKNLADPN